MNYFYITAAVCLLMHNRMQAFQPCVTKWPKKQQPELPQYQTILKQIQRVTPEFDLHLTAELYGAVERNDFNRVQSIIKPQQRPWYSSWFQSRKISPDINEHISSAGDDTILIIATRKGFIDIVHLLIEAGANVNAKNKSGQTALIVAARKNRINITMQLIAAGADLDVKSNKAWTALMWAADEGNLDIVELLLAAGADSNIKDRNGWTALTWAASRTSKYAKLSGKYDERNKEIIKILLAYDAQPTTQFWKIANENPNVMKIIAEYNQEGPLQRVSIEQAVSHALPEAGWQDVSQIIGQYAARPLVQEDMEVKEKMEVEHE